MKVSLTIEKQLKSYIDDNKSNNTPANKINDSDILNRYEILWSTWINNKLWLSELLDMVSNCFISYSKHDKTHANVVLHNIEMILGEENIKSLSATDCFLLLHTVYLHDIGMCITHSEKVQILEDNDFLKMVDFLAEYGNDELKKSVENLNKSNYDYESLRNDDEKRKKMYVEKLEVYYAILNLISHYRRKDHAEVSRQKLQDWISEPLKLGTGFSMSGIPLRIFLKIADCASLHTSSKFEDILAIDEIDNGYAHDYIHPRFIAVLLQIGDALDMDNNRFHPLMKDFIGDIPWDSEKHYQKHLSIRTLFVNKHTIVIKADCKTQDALRLIKAECDYLLSFLQKSSYYWSIIAPHDFVGYLPTLLKPELYLDGVKIPDELVTTKFSISQTKAFNILKGANIYDNRFVFLREIVQNALDATKIQYWLDFRGSAEYYIKDHEHDNSICQILNMNKIRPFDSYPIEIELKLARKDKEGKVEKLRSNQVNSVRENDGYEYGVSIKVRDFGTGISERDIKNISKVGSSYLDKKEIMNTMPEWLKPTCEFGIGLQSAFLLMDTFKCKTYNRDGTNYEINFSSNSSPHEGYINVRPLKDNNNYYAYGTCFEFFLNCNLNSRSKISMPSWTGKDPFSEDYDEKRPLRYSIELLSQVALYLDSQMGETIFPLKLKVYELNTGCYLGCDEMDVDSGFNFNYPLNVNDENKIKHLNVEYWVEKKCKFAKKLEENDLYKFDNKLISWIRNFEDDDKTKRIVKQYGDDIYILDCEKAKLYIWNSEINCFARIGAQRLLEGEKYTNDKDKDKHSKELLYSKIYYKGVKLQDYNFSKDAELIEYIDIKGSLGDKHLKLNREGFTEKGNEYLEETICKTIIKTAKKALYLFNDEDNGFVKVICDNIENKAREIEQNTKGKKRVSLINDLIEMILSASCLSLFSKLETKDSRIRVTPLKNSKDGNNKNSNKWDDLIKEMNETVQAFKNNNLKILEECTFLNLNCLNENGNLESTDFIDVIDKENKYIVVSKLDYKNGPWTQVLVKTRPEGIHDIIRELQKDLEDEKDIDKLISALDGRVSTIVNNIETNFFKKDGEKEKLYKDQYITKWIMRNVPSIGLFRKDDLTRVNVLGNEAYDTLFMDSNTKLANLEKMCNIYEKSGIERFSTLPWIGLKFLNVTSTYSSVFFVKKGYMTEEYYPEVIVPLTGGKLCEIRDSFASAERNLKKEIEVYEREIENKLSAEQINANVKQKIEEEMSNGKKEEKKKEFDDMVRGELNPKMVSYIVENNRNSAPGQIHEEDIETFLKGYIDEIFNVFYYGYSKKLDEYLESKDKPKAEEGK